MKTPLVLFSCLSTAVLAAADTITVHGGDSDRSDVIVSFAAPKELRGTHLIRGDDGSATALQVDEAGHAAFVLGKIGKGEIRHYTFAPSLPVFATTGVFVAKKGSRLEVRSVPIRSDGGVDNSQVIFDYQMEAGDVPDGVPPIFKHGAHLHPVYSPSGKMVTGNHPPDHRWHRGIWMAWTDTEFEGRHPDFWNQGKGDGNDKSGGKLLAEVRFDSLVKMWAGPVHGGFVSKHRFIDNGGDAAKDVLDETWSVTAYAITAGAKPISVFDLVSTQTCAGLSGLKLPKYHYGGLGIRGNALWDPVEKVTMLTSNGDDRKKGDSTKGKWVHLGGEVDGQATGIAVLIHPDNFRFPQPLRLNPKNPQICVAPSQDGDWSIEPGKPYVSKYRFIVCDGVADAAMLDAAWKNYAEPLKVVVE